MGAGTSVGSYHQQPKRVRTHIFVATLAFLLTRALEKKLKAAAMPMSSAQALEALRTMHVVDIRVGAEVRRGVTAGNHQARQILGSRGKIVNIASCAALIGRGRHHAYSASKAAVVNLTRNLAVMYGPQRININAVCPGLIPTALTRPTTPEIEQWHRDALQDTPWPRLGTPQDVAHCVLFLTTPEAEWVTGIALAVDGGASAK